MYVMEFHDEAFHSFKAILQHISWPSVGPRIESVENFDNMLPELRAILKERVE